MTINGIWTHVPLSRPPTTESTPFVEGESYDCGRVREASSVGGSDIKSRSMSESSGEGLEMVTSKVDDTE